MHLAESSSGMLRRHTRVTRDTRWKAGKLRTWLPSRSSVPKAKASAVAQSMVSPASRSCVAHLPCPKIQKMSGKTCLWQDIMNGFSGGWFMNHYEPKQELHTTILNLLSSCFFLSCRFNPACACGDQLNQSESNVSEKKIQKKWCCFAGNVKGDDRILDASGPWIHLECSRGVRQSFAAALCPHPWDGCLIHPRGQISSLDYHHTTIIDTRQYTGPQFSHVNVYNLSYAARVVQV